VFGCRNREEEEPFHSGQHENSTPMKRDHSLVFLLLWGINTADVFVMCNAIRLLSTP